MCSITLVMHPLYRPARAHQCIQWSILLYGRPGIVVTYYTLYASAFQSASSQIATTMAARL